MSINKIIKLNDSVDLVSTGLAKKGHKKGVVFSKHPHMAEALVNAGKAVYKKDFKGDIEEDKGGKSGKK